MEKTEDMTKPLPWAKRWYSFNKQKIPMIFTFFGTIFFTAFLDFNIQGTDIKLLSHIAAIKKLSNSILSNLSALFIFAIYLIAIMQLFNTFTFAKKRSPFGLIMISVLTVVQCVLVGFYTAVFYVEQANVPQYVLGDAARLSYTVFIIGAVLFLIGSIFAWFYVDWKYVKIPEE